MNEEDKVRYIELKLNEIKKNVEEKDKEIERLNGALQTHEILLKSNVLEIERLQKLLDIEKNKREQFDKNNQLLHSIIKEVREYIENNKEYTTIKKPTERWQNGKVIFEESDEDILNEDMIKEILEILDKVKE